MPASEIVSGVGTRYGVVFKLDSVTGVPMPATASADPYVGTEIEHITGTEASDPEPRRITHRGEDRPYAQDSLPSNDFETFSMTTSAANMNLDATLEGTEVRAYTNVKARVVNSDRKGNEAQVMAMFYRQALDTDPASQTFGLLRQWEARIYPSTRIIPVTHSYGTEETEKRYEGVPTNVRKTPWSEDLTTADWGVNEGAHIDLHFAAHPRFNFYRGNGTLTAFKLSHPPVDADHLRVWVNGTLTTPSSVNVSATAPSFTLTAAPANNAQVAALIQTNNP